MRKRGDHLADPAGCIRDVPWLKEFQIKVARIYALMPVESDSECMAVSAQAGIDVTTDHMAPGYVIDIVNLVRNSVPYNSNTSIIDMMHNYTSR